MPVVDTLNKRETGSDVNKECKRKHLFSKQSQISNILPYYAEISACDRVMSNLSHESRKIWKDALPMWIRLIDDELKPLRIDSRNIDRWTSNHCIYHCKLVFDIYQMQSIKWPKKILKFIKSLPSARQISIFMIHKSLYGNWIKRDTSCLPNIAKNILAIAETIGPGILQKSKDTKFERFKDVYFSDVITGTSSCGRIHQDLGIFSKVSTLDKVVCINSKYIIDKKRIIFKEKVEDTDFPELCKLSLNDSQVPLLSDITKIYMSCYPKEKFKIEADVHYIIKKCYPNLQELVCSAIKIFESINLTKICEIIQGTSIKAKINDERVLNQNEIQIQSKKAFIVPIKKSKSPPKIYEVEIEASSTMFYFHGDYLYCYSFDTKWIKNCCRRRKPSKKYPLLEYLYDSSNPTSHFFTSNPSEWLMIPISSIQTLHSTYLSISECQFYKTSFPKPSSFKSTELLSNYSLYSSLPSTCLFTLNFTTSPLETSFPPYTFPYKSILHCFAQIDCRTSVEIPLFYNKSHPCPSFSVVALSKYDEVNVVLYADVRAMRNVGELFRKVRKLSGLRNLGRVRVMVFDGTTRRSVMDEEMEECKGYLRQMRFRPDVKVSVRCTRG